MPDRHAHARGGQHASPPFLQQFPSVETAHARRSHVAWRLLRVRRPDLERLVREESDGRETCRGRVAFRVRDIYFPEPREVLSQLYGDELLHGRVVDFTDCGQDERVLAVIEVEGGQRRVVVPVDRVKDLP